MWKQTAGGKTAWVSRWPDGLLVCFFTTLELERVRLLKDRWPRERIRLEAGWAPAHRLRYAQHLINTGRIDEHGNGNAGGGTEQ